MKVARKYTEAQLLKAIADPAERNEGIRFLYEEYAQAISSFIISRGGTEQDAQDIFQEAIVAFADACLKGSYRMESSIRTFLIAISKNIWFNEIKKRSRSGFREKQYEMTKELNEPDVSELMGEREIKKQFVELMGKLGEPCKKILTLFYYENLSMKEILKQLPYENEQVVRNKKYKCLSQLTQMVKNNPSIAGQLKEFIK